MKNIKVKILLMLIFILLILLTIVYFMTDVFKSPRTLFYKYLIDGNISNVTNMDYDEFLENIKSPKDYSNSGKVKIKIDSSDNNIGMSNQFDLDYLHEMDASNQNQYINLKGNYASKELINLEVLINQSKIGIKEKDFNDKYIAIDVSKLDETLSKYGITSENINNIKTDYNLYNLLYISKEDRNTIINNYKEVLYKDIYKKNYSVKRNVMIDVNGNEYKCNSYKLNLTGEEATNLYIDLLEKLKSDDLTINLIVERYNMIESEKISKEKLLNSIQKEIDKLSLKTTYEGDIAITVYENNSRTIRTEISKDNNTICIDTTRANNDLTMLIKNDIDNSKSELLINVENASEGEKNYKIIQTKGKDKIKIDISNKMDTKLEKAIQTLDKDNSYNVSEMNSEETEKFNVEMQDSLNKFILNKANLLGIPSNLFMNENDYINNEVNM